MPDKIDEQIAALKNLRSMYALAGMLPKTRRIPFEDAHEAHEVEKEIVLKEIDYSSRRDKAQRELLSTGFPVPDHWLDLDVGRVGDSWTRGGPTILTFDQGDIDGIKRATKEMSLAILRLESEPRNTTVAAADDRLTVTEVSAQYDIDRANVTRRCRSGKLAGAQMVNGEWRIPEASVKTAGWEKRVIPTAKKHTPKLAEAVQWECSACDGETRMSDHRPGKPCSKCNSNAWTRSKIKSAS